jgi:hypothetical protein
VKKIKNVSEVKKGDKVLVKEVSIMWDGAKAEYYYMCFEYVFEVVRNNPKTFGCKYINGPHYGGGFNWIKGHELTGNGKEYFLIENGLEVADKHYKVRKPHVAARG